MKTVIEMAREAGWDDHHAEFDTRLKRFAALVIANHPPQSYMTWQEGYEAGKQAEREACAKVAGWLWQQFQDTKDAHERNSMEPFKWGQFGFDQSTVQQSKRMMDAIRARSEK
jgi:hypothetical protein